MYFKYLIVSFSGLQNRTRPRWRVLNSETCFRRSPTRKMVFRFQVKSPSNRKSSQNRKPSPLIRLLFLQNRQMLRNNAELTVMLVSPTAPIRCQFHQRSTSNFCVCRSLKCKKDLPTWLSFSHFRDRCAKQLLIELVSLFLPDFLINISTKRYTNIFVFSYTLGLTNVVSHEHFCFLKLCF